MNKREKLWATLFLIVAVAVMFLLATGLSNLELSPGQSYYLGQRMTGDIGIYYSSSQGKLLVLVFRIFFTLMLVLLPFTIIYLLISPEARKKALRDFMGLLLFLLFYYLLSSSKQNVLKELGETMRPETMPEMPEMANLPTPPPFDFDAQTPSWLIMLASFVLALVLVAVILRVISARKREAESLYPVEQLAQEAQEALDALQSGGDLKNVVLRCYFEMAQAVNKQQGIQRSQAMTTREFQMRLEEAGLPRQPVRQLTQLFESVRYGSLAPGEREEQQAVASLSAIVAACRSTS